MTSMNTCDIYLRLSDARLEEALDGREAKLRAEADRLGWDVHRVVIENDLSPNGKASAFKRKKITLPNGRTELRTVRPGFRSVLGDIMAGTTCWPRTLTGCCGSPGTARTCWTRWSCPARRPGR
jgi:hypothetical protein